MHTPRMNFRQSMSLNEAVMEAMMGKKPMQADLEKMSGDEREILRKHFQAYKDNPREVEKLVVQAAVEDGRMKAEDIEEEAGAMGGRGGAAPPAGGAAPADFSSSSLSSSAHPPHPHHRYLSSQSCYSPPHLRSSSSAYSLSPSYSRLHLQRPLLRSNLGTII